MNYTLISIISLSIIVPSLVGLIRFTKINEAFYPFIYLIWIGLLNEVFSVIIMHFGYSNIINLNIYLLAEALLVLWQFQRWDLFCNNSGLLKIVFALILGFWLFENIFIASITQYNSYFNIFYASLITFMSISIINRLIVSERKSLLRNPVFIICSVFIIYFTMNILSEVFWIYGISLNKEFREKVHSISVTTNFISIILYTLAIIWMPIKQRFSLPSS